MKMDIEMDIRQELRNYATQYDIGKYKLVWRGKSWAILGELGKWCYDKKHKKFIYEPTPSNRDETFFKNCRFSLAEAKKIIEKLAIVDRLEGKKK